MLLVFCKDLSLFHSQLCSNLVLAVSAMAYYIAFVRPSLCRIAGRANLFYEKLFIAASECHGEGQYPVFKFYCKNGVFPYWFGRQAHVEVSEHYEVSEDYEPLRQVLSSSAPQRIYALRKGDNMVLYVHTPESDAEGVFAVFESTSYDPTQLLGCGGEVRFLYYSSEWEPHDQLILERELLMQKLRSIGIAL